MRRGILWLVLLAPLAFAGEASACSCVPLTSERVKEADAAAVVKLESVEPVSQVTADYTYAVRDVVAGGGVRDGEEITIRSNRDSAACGLNDTVGAKKGLVLDRIKGAWRSSLCSETSPKNLRRLAKGKSARGPAGCP